MARPFRYETDGPYLLKLTGVGVAFLGLCLVGTAWAFFILLFETRSILPLGEPIPEGTRAAEVGVVYKTLFATDTRFELERNRDRAALENWGWQDRPQKTVHMPIDEAMKRLVGTYGPTRNSVRGND